MPLYPLGYGDVSEARYDEVVKDYTIAGLMLVVAGIHLLPASGFLGRRQLQKLYGVEIEKPELEILMRHRAILFGILGGFFAYAAFEPAVQPLAFVAASVSVGSFLYLAISVGSYGPEVRQVIFVDLIAAGCLLAAITPFVLRLDP
jgi:hypothetical protein